LGVWLSFLQEQLAKVTAQLAAQIEQGCGVEAQADIKAGLLAVKACPVILTSSGQACLQAKSDISGRSHCYPYTASMSPVLPVSVLLFF